MTNYMRKTRLIKIFYTYIYRQKEYLKSFKKAVKEYGKDLMFEYIKYRIEDFIPFPNNKNTALSCSEISKCTDVICRI